MSQEPKRLLGDIEHFYCNGCGNETSHLIVAEIVRSRWDGEVETWKTSHILECGGCQHTVLRKRVHYSEFERQPGDFDPDDETFPPHTLYREPAWLDSLDGGGDEVESACHTGEAGKEDSFRKRKLKNILREVYASLNAGMRFLPAVGIRTALDRILVDHVGDFGTFERRLDRLVGANVVTPEERARLDVLTDVGSAAAHRGHAPTPEVLVTILKILELVVEKLYVHAKQGAELSAAADKIRATIPQRPNKKKPLGSGP